MNFMATTALAFLMASPALAQQGAGSIQTVVPTRVLGGGVSATPPSSPTPLPAAVPAPAPQATTTPATTPVAPPTQATAQPARPAVAATPVATVPPSENAVSQSIKQLEGVFPEMERPAAGGQIQDAWDISDHHDGVYPIKLCNDCVYKVRLREFMVTTLALPDDAVIAGAPDLGDGAGFEVVEKSPNRIAVRPKMAGVDTNLNVYTRSGRVYPFYLRAESYNSIRVPDILVRVTGLETPPPLVAFNGKINDKEKKSKSAQAVDNLINPVPAEGDFVRTIAFDPAKLHGWENYKLWGDDDLKPETVFRDDQFTYIQYGKTWDSKELPTAYVVVDGIDELVNTRVQGNTFIVETIAPLVSLKSGKKFLCLQYTGEKP